MNASILQPFPIPAIVEEVISNSSNLYIYYICNNHKGKNLYYDMPLYTQINVKSVDLIPAKICNVPMFPKQNKSNDTHKAHFKMYSTKQEFA